MNQIGINKQQKTQKNTKNKFRDIREIRWQKNTLRQPSGSSGSSGDKEKRLVIFVSSVGNKKKKFVVKHKLIINF